MRSGNIIKLVALGPVQPITAKTKRKINEDSAEIPSLLYSSDHPYRWCALASTVLIALHSLAVDTVA